MESGSVAKDVPPLSRLIGPLPARKDPDAYDRLRRRVLWALPTGLYVLGSAMGQERNLMTCNLVTQVATEPKLVGVAVETDARTAQLVQNGAGFTLNLLDQQDRALVRNFVKPATDDREQMMLNGHRYLDAPVTGAPVLQAAVAYLDCRLVSATPYISHIWFVGEVVDVDLGEKGDGGESLGTILRMEDTRMNYGG